MPKCTVLYIKVHCHNRLTKHLFFQKCKSIPLSAHLREEGAVSGRRGANTRQQRGGGPGEARSRPRGRRQSEDRPGGETGGHRAPRPGAGGG